MFEVRYMRRDERVQLNNQPGECIGWVSEPKPLTSFELLSGSLLGLTAHSGGTAERHHTIVMEWYQRRDLASERYLQLSI